jgi:flagellar biosynthetic protein FliR
MLESLVASQAAGFALVLARIAGFVVVSPFPGANVSSTQRVGLVAVLAWIASSFAPVSHAPHEIGLPLALAAALEIGCGVVIGAAFRFLILAADFLGQVLSHAIGLSMASVLNPLQGDQDTVVSRIVTLMAMLLALGAGVHRTALAYVLSSFRMFPVGSALTLPGSSLVLTDLAVRSITVGLGLAMPVIAVNLVVHIGLAMMARAAPALQILHVGLSLVLATGFLTLLTTLPDVGHGLVAHYATLGRVLDSAFSSMAEPIR